MINEKYERAEIEIIKFHTDDIIATSDLHYTPEEDELSKIGG